MELNVLRGPPMMVWKIYTLILFCSIYTILGNKMVYFSDEFKLKFPELSRAELKSFQVELKLSRRLFLYTVL